jgi:hypothetical protein
MLKILKYSLLLMIIYSCNNNDQNINFGEKLLLKSNEIYLNLDTVSFIEYYPGITIELLLKNNSKDTIKIENRNSIKSGLDTTFKHSVLLLGAEDSYVLNSYYSNIIYILPKNETKVSFFLNMSDVFLKENGNLPIVNIDILSKAYLNKLENIKYISLYFSINNENVYVERLINFKIDKIHSGNY